MGEKNRKILLNSSTRNNESMVLTELGSLYLVSNSRFFLFFRFEDAIRRKMCPAVQEIERENGVSIEYSLGTSILLFPASPIEWLRIMIHYIWLQRINLELEGELFYPTNKSADRNNIKILFSVISLSDWTKRVGDSNRAKTRHNDVPVYNFVTEFPCHTSRTTYTDNKRHAWNALLNEPSQPCHIFVKTRCWNTTLAGETIERLRRDETRKQRELPAQLIGKREIWLLIDQRRKTGREKLPMGNRRMAERKEGKQWNGKTHWATIHSRASLYLREENGNQTRVTSFPGLRWGQSLGNYS